MQDFLKSDYDRIREHEELRTQIEKYHEGLELQEDGTYKAEPGPTAERNAELAHIAVRDEQRRKYEQRIRDEQMRREKSHRYNDFER